MNTFEKSKIAISTATVNGNFNSDLIEDKELRRPALLTYINKTVKENPESALREYQTADAFVYSEVANMIITKKRRPKSTACLTFSTIILAVLSPRLSKKSDSYI